MFGLFGKKNLENEAFNNALIASLGEADKLGRLPTEDELVRLVEGLAKDRKLSEGQSRSIRACANLAQFESMGAELRRLAIAVRREAAAGKRRSFDELLEFLGRHGVITRDSDIELMRGLGIKM